MWRYSPIDELALDDFARRRRRVVRRRRSGRGRAPLESLRTALGDTAGSVLVHGGRAIAHGPAPATAPRRRRPSAGRPRRGRAADMLGLGPALRDALVRLNDAFMARPRLRRRRRRGDGRGPGARRALVRARRRGLPAHACPRRRGGVRGLGGRGVRRARRRRVPRGAGHRAVAPMRRVAVVRVAPGPGTDSAWSLARLAACGGGARRSAPSPSGLGAAYDRIRTDVTVDGRDARSEILSAYLGDGVQVHDVRTLQDHAAPKTTSELLCQGAVAGPVALRLQRPHPGAPGRGAQRRPPDEPQPGARRGRGRRLRPEPRHPRERREVLPRLDGGTGGRGPALLHRVAGWSPKWPRA